MSEKDQTSGDTRKQDTGGSMDPTRLQMLLENMSGVFVLTESDEKTVRIVSSSLDMFNPFICPGDNNDPHQEGDWLAILPEDVEATRTTILESVRTKTPLVHTFRVCTPEGGIAWRALRGTHLPDQGDGLHRMLHVVNDITREREIEAELREKTSIIDFAMRNTDVNLWYFDYETAECRLTQSCQRAHEMPGVERLEDFPECLIESGYVREDCAELMRTSYRRLRENGESVEFDVWFRRADGSGWWCERDMLSPLVGPDGRVTQGIGIGKDVSVEKALEEKYRAFEAYRAMAQKSTIASVRMNLTTGWCGDYISSNDFVPDEARMDTVDEFFRTGVRSVCSEEENGPSGLSREFLLEAFARGETSRSMEFRYQMPGRRPMWLRTMVDMMKNPVTGDVEALYYAFDIDYEKNMKFMMEQLVSTDYEFLGLVCVETGHLLVFGNNRDTDGMARNGSCYDSEMPRVFRELIPEAYFEEGTRLMDRAHIIRELEGKSYYLCSFPARAFGNSKAGRKQWKCAYLDESRSQILVTRVDITDIYTAERDELTGLYNRQAFYRHAREILDAEPHRTFLLLRLDIDRFKAYNDARGIKAGDRLLATYGKAIREKSWPEKFVFCRIEADHFCVLLPKEGVNLEELLERYFSWLEETAPDYHLVSSVGVYEIVDPSIDVSLMCDRALLALYSIKGGYQNKVAWYDEELRQRLIREQTLMDEMERAVEEEQFVLYYQPQINYESGAIVGVEALVRWAHPKRGLLPPGQFIPLFEKNGFILKLDAYVWEKACQQLRAWLDRGEFAPPPVSVNISRCDIYDAALCQRLCALIKTYELPMDLLKLEITESAYMEDPGQLLEVARELQAAGFAVEMDDFGAGYSSLNTLKDVPVDVLKLDMQFLTTGWDNARGGLILSSVIRMARWLRIPVMAEGVETTAQAEYLKSLSCLYMQGYLFARPMPVEELECCLRQRTVDSLRKESGSGADAFWDMETRESLFYNQTLVGAAILEYDGENAEILRANDRFYTELGTTRSDYLDKQGSTLRRFAGRHQEVYRAMLEQAVHNAKEAECQVMSLPHGEDGASFWTSNRVRLLSKSEGRALLHLVVWRLDTQKTQVPEIGANMP